MMEVKTFDEFLYLINHLAEQQSPECGDRIWFRGEHKCDRELLPQIFRRSKDGEYIYHVETHYTNSFQIKARQALPNCPDGDSYDAWISIMRHYGLPTRLLDWTSSPLVALYFATNGYERYDCDAAIYVLFPRKLNEAEGFGPYIPPMCHERIKAALAPAFSSKLELSKSKIYEERKTNVVFGDVIACQPVDNNPRIYMQQSTFTIQTSPKRTLADACPPGALTQIIIPKDCKKHFFLGLRTFGMTEDYLFPDLTHIAQEASRVGNARSQVVGKK